MWEEPMRKFFCMYKWGLFIVKVKTGPSDFSTSFMTVWLSTLHSSWSIGLPRYITLIYKSIAHSSDVAGMTHNTNWHDSAGMFMLVVVCMSSCNATEWWISSWCIIASPSHSKLCRVLDGDWVRLMLHFHIVPFLYFGMVDMFVHLQKYLLSCSFICEDILAWSSVREQISWHVSFVHPFANTCVCMYSPFSSRLSLFHVYSCTYDYNHSWRDDNKSINLLVYHDVWSFNFGCRWPGERTWLQNCAR